MPATSDADLSQFFLQVSCIVNSSLANCTRPSDDNAPQDHYLMFYAISTPIIVLIGLLGNILCIVLLHGKPIRRHRSSSFFIALAIADICCLIFYVTIEWAERGLAELLYNKNLDTGWARWRDNEGVCQLVFYLMYVVRLLAAWILVVTSVERYFGVCRPLLQRRIFSPCNGRRILVAVFIFSLVFPLWKPILSGMVREDSGMTCGQREDSRQVHFILHVVYAVALTLLPNTIILFFSVLIARRLLGLRQHLPAPCCYNWHRTGTSMKPSPVLVTPTRTGIPRKGVRHEVVGTQFALLLVLVSSTYLLLSWPYFVCWLLHDLVLRRDIFPSPEAGVRGDTALSQRIRLALHLTRPLMYLTYTVNFFIYSMTGRLFRRQLARMFRNRGSAFHIQLQEIDRPGMNGGVGSKESSSSREKYVMRRIDFKQCDKKKRQSTLETNLDPVKHS